jgi:anti-sigma B factor antagonist
LSQGMVIAQARSSGIQTSIIDINGSITAQSENALMDAFTTASGNPTRGIILNFSGLDYMNSTGIGLLVTLLVRANRQQQQMLAFGLNDHYRNIFELTRLNEAIHIYGDEAAAVHASESL